MRRIHAHLQLDEPEPKHPPFSLVVAGRLDVQVQLVRRGDD